MTLPQFFLRFTTVYIAAIVIAVVVVSVLGIRGHIGVNTAAVWAAAVWACQMFARKNGRYFYPYEQWCAVLGMVGIDVSIQVVMMVGFVFLSGAALQLSAALYALALVTLLHAVGMALVVLLGGALYARRRRA